MPRNVILAWFAFFMAMATIGEHALRAADQPSKQQPKWEYAILTHSGTAVGGYVFRWETGKRVLESPVKKTDEAALKELYKALGGKEENVRLALFLDYIGADGWELASHTYFMVGSEHRQSWTFKRQVR